MKVETAREKMMSNFEVYQHLKEIQVQNNWVKPDPSTENSKKQHRKVHNHDLETVTSQIVSYLDKTEIEEQSVEKITNLLADLSKFKLEKIEKLQIVNTSPHSLVTLYAIVEECDQRFSEDECNEILEIISNYFPLKDQEGDIELEDEENIEGDEQYAE